MKLSEAKHYRMVIEQSAQSLPDETALTAVTFYPHWASGVSYEADHRVQYNDTLYRCLTAHTSQDAWTPEIAPSLWAKVLVSEDGTILAWEQPDSTNPYMKGDKVTHNGKTWVSDLDNNVWEPGVYGWTEVTK